MYNIYLVCLARMYITLNHAHKTHHCLGSGVVKRQGGTAKTVIAPIVGCRATYATYELRACVCVCTSVGKHMCVHTNEHTHECTQKSIQGATHSAMHACYYMDASIIIRVTNVFNLL